MSPFGRRRRAAQDADAAPDPTTQAEPDATGTDDVSDTDDVSETDAARGPDADGGAGPRGPWDVTQVSELGARVDLGALRIPALPGMQLRMEMDKTGTRLLAVNLGLAGSALQLQAFAAPRTEGIWDELRAEIATSVTRKGGTADDVAGPFGREVLARLPVRTPDGRTGHRPARFIGVDGPRWFVRGVLTGQAAVQPESAKVLEAVLADVVVVRGDDARPPRDLLPLHLPGRPAGRTPGPVEQPPAVPPIPQRRGPEITEIR